MRVIKATLIKTLTTSNRLSVTDKNQYITFKMIPSQLQSDALISYKSVYTPRILESGKVKISQLCIAQFILE